MYRRKTRYVTRLWRLFFRPYVCLSTCNKPRPLTSQAIISSGQADAKLPGDRHLVFFGRVGLTIKRIGLHEQRKLFFLHFLLACSCSRLVFCRTPGDMTRWHSTSSQVNSAPRELFSRVRVKEGADKIPTDRKPTAKIQQLLQARKYEHCFMKFDKKGAWCSVDLLIGWRVP